MSAPVLVRGQPVIYTRADGDERVALALRQTEDTGLAALAVLSDAVNDVGRPEVEHVQHADYSAEGDPGTWRPVDAAIALQKRTLTTSQADFNGLGDGDTSQAVEIGDPLPANARIVGVEIRLATAFSGGGNAAVSVDIGGTDADALVDGANLFTGAPAAAHGTSGINPNGNLGGQQLTATFMADVGLKELTAGSVVIDVLYSVLA